LTDEGIIQCKLKGKKFNTKLIKSWKLFDKHLNLDKFEIISTDKKRVKDSAFVFIKSLFNKDINLNKKIKVIDKRNS